MFERQSRSRSMDENTAGLPGADPRLLLATIVHDFNNFLTPIVTILEELQSQNVGTARQLRRIDAALFCAFRAKTLARQLLDFATPRKIESAAVDVSQLLESLEPILASVLQPGFTLRLDIADDLAPAFIDRKLMERALLNLVLNARDAMPDGGEVVVSASVDRPPISNADLHGPMIRLSVADPGVGMTRATLRTAGMRYASSKSHGTGLGLAMVRQMMEGQSGGLSITSTPHHGTVIDLWLPIVPSYVTGPR